MIGFIKDWAVNIVMLVLFIVMTEMLLPGGKIKKYVNLMTGTVLIIAIIEPVTGLISRDFDFSVSQTTSARIMDKKEIEKAGMMLEVEQIKQTTELYRKKIIEQIEQHVKEVEGVTDAEADVIINEDHSSEAFGEIKRIYIKAGIEGTERQTAGVEAEYDDAVIEGESPSDRNDGGFSSNVRISGVEKIGRIRIGNPQSHEGASEVIDNMLEARIAERIGEVFGVSRDNIVISQMQR